MGQSHRHHSTQRPRLSQRDRLSWQYALSRFRLAPLGVGLGLILLTGCDRAALEGAFAPDPQLVAEGEPPSSSSESTTAPGGSQPVAQPPDRKSQTSPGGGSSPRATDDDSASTKGKEAVDGPSREQKPDADAKLEKAGDRANTTDDDEQLSSSGDDPSQSSSSPNSNIPAELESTVADVLALGVLTPPDQAGVGRGFDPNQIVTRGEFARWLLAANNVVYGDRPAAQIRLATNNSEPVFKDVSTTDLNFPAIQGLAEAGIILSSLSGDQDQINFRPDAPLTREAMLLWKVPLDVRSTLPTSNLEAVKEAWGFQDASKASASALRAILADYGNGDQAVIRRVFGYTTLLQPQKPVTQAEAAAALGYFGRDGQGISAGDIEVGKLGERDGDERNGNENIGG